MAELYDTVYDMDLVDEQKSDESRERGVSILYSFLGLSFVAFALSFNRI